MSRKLTSRKRAVSTMRIMAIGKQKMMCSLLSCQIYELGMCDIVEHSIVRISRSNSRPRRDGSKLP
jgi:hypothetical protein